MITASRSFPARAARQQGFVVITCLLLLAVVIILVTSMFRNLGLVERIAGTTGEKQRSFQAAQSTLMFAEWWLVNCDALTPGTTPPASCSGLTNPPAHATTPISNPTSVPWVGQGSSYSLPGMTVASGGGWAAAKGNPALPAGDINYSNTPSLHVYYVGAGPDPKTALYQVTAAGYGGGAGNASVVQSTVEVPSYASDLGNP